MAGDLIWEGVALACTFGLRQRITRTWLDEMAQNRWGLDDVPWDRIVPVGVDSGIVAVIKAAALVEYNAHSYAAHLGKVFAEDPSFQAMAQEWAAEEVQHGLALGRWASLVDPAFNFEAAVARFRDLYHLPQVSDSRSIRGSHSGELVARCMVETGTSSFYSAVAEATQEPVLRFICQRIAADEYRHYKLFLTYMKPCLVKDKVSRIGRAWIGIGRILETKDDELACAYHAANSDGQAYDRTRASQAYEWRAFRLYRRHHIERAVGMALKAWGVSPQSTVAGLARRAAWWLLETRVGRLERAAV